MDRVSAVSARFMSVRRATHARRRAGRWPGRRVHARTPQGRMGADARRRPGHCPFQHTPRTLQRHARLQLRADSADNTPGPATLSGGVAGDSLRAATNASRPRVPAQADGLRRRGRKHALHFAAVSGDRITLEVKERGADQLGTRNVKRLRRQGLIPGVLYGKANKAFVVGERELRIALTGPSGSARDRRCRDRGPEDAASRRPQGLPAASRPRHDHARRLPRGSPRPADPGDGRRAARR